MVNPLMDMDMMTELTGSVAAPPSSPSTARRLRRPRATWRPTRGWPACPTATSPTATRRCRRRQPTAATRPRACGGCPRPSSTAAAPAPPRPAEVRLCCCSSQQARHSRRQELLHRLVIQRPDPSFIPLALALLLPSSTSVLSLLPVHLHQRKKKTPCETEMCVQYTYTYIYPIPNSIILSQVILYIYSSKY